MAMKYMIERTLSGYELLYGSAEEGVEVVSTHTTKRDADAARKRLQIEDSKLRASERSYQSGCAYACGYHN
jgi:predicted nuclease with RNAse H fold